MMMMSTKSLEVFDEILKWADKNIKIRQPGVVRGRRRLGRWRRRSL